MPSSPSPVRKYKRHDLENYWARIAIPSFAAHKVSSSQLIWKCNFNPLKIAFKLLLKVILVQNSDMQPITLA